MLDAHAKDSVVVLRRGNAASTPDTDERYAYPDRIILVIFRLTCWNTLHMHDDKLLRSCRIVCGSLAPEIDP